MITPTDNLAALLLVELDLSGPRAFGHLYRLAQAATASKTLQPGTLHDLLNNLLASGRLKLAPTGFYYLA